MKRQRRNAKLAPPGTLLLLLMEQTTQPRRPVIIGVSAYQLSEHIRNVGAALQARAQVSVVNAHFDEALAEIQRRQESAPCDVVVSAGANAEFLRNHLSIPVISVRVGGHDVMAAIVRARAISERIAVVLHRDAGNDMAKFAEVFALPITFRSYESAQDVSNVIAELQRLDTRVVVGAGVVMQAVAAAGMAGVFLYSADSVRLALEDAIALANAKAVERSRYSLLNSVLYHLGDGVVALDATGKLIAANPAAEKLVGRPLIPSTGKTVSLPFPALRPGLSPSDGEHDSGAVEEIDGRTVIIDRAPLYEGNVRVGAVLTLHQPTRVEKAFNRLRTHQYTHSQTARYKLDDIVGTSPAMAATITRCRVAAERSDATVLITGPTGVGKELLAQGLHNASRRRRHPFLAVNCGALPETLLETELFGYEEGAFTGARRNGKAGLFEAANEGTVFLDEVAEMPPLLQTRLLRVLQEREVTRVGGTDTLQVNVRIVAATHRDLWERVREGAFRQDLFYRLSVLRLQVPPLRERPEDRDILATALVSAALRRVQLADLVDAVLPAALAVAGQHAWPGNVRELENFAERVAMACLETGAAVPATQLAALLDRDTDHYDSLATNPEQPDTTLSGMTIANIREVLKECGENRTLAAKRLGIARSTLWRLLKE